MTIKNKQDGAALILEIEGRVDTTTSPELQNKTLEAFQSTKELVLDFA